MNSIRRFAALCAVLLLTMLPVQMAHADPEDIQASARSVVRVALIAMQGEEVFFLGHGSGFAVTPDTIITNAHVVQPSTNDRSIIVGVVPSEGSEIYRSRIVAYSPQQDLALIRIEQGSLEPISIFGQQVGDGSDIVAIGYPGAVDRALGLTDGDKVEPGTPIKTTGTISGGRSNREFATFTHTAAVARGNSGGPIVDECGRVVGVNSFISVSDGSDAEFGFAISNQELLSFLRNSGISPRIATTPCRSSAQISQAETRRALAEIAQQGDEAMARAREEQRRQAALERSVDQEIRSERENYMAAALLLVVLAGFSGTAALTFAGRPDAGKTRIAGGVAAIMGVGAVALFLLRPSYDEFTDRLAIAIEQRTQPEDDQPQQIMAQSYVGDNICTIQSERSRITISQANDIGFSWSDSGCVNGRTQYGRDGDEWVRILVPNEEQTVSVYRFNPDSGELALSRYLLGLEAMQQARNIRSRFGGEQCSNDKAMRDALEGMQDALLAIIPQRPNERLVYQCASRVGNQPDRIEAVAN
ncbi:MAG: trypsin-like peptidase domain-containing protein [Pseudomonadota bacterium]